MGNSCSGYGAEADELLRNAENGDQQKMLQTLQKRPELIACRKGLSASKTVWHVVAKTGNMASLQALVAFARSDASPYGHLHPPQREQKLQAMMNVENVRGHTPLVIACLHGHEDVVALFVTSGADAYIGDRIGDTGLHMAARRGHAGCIRAIMRNIPPVEARRQHYSLQDIPSMSGLAPMHFAVASNHLDCVEALLEHNAYLLARSKIFSTDLGFALAAGSSPLHVAAEQGHVDIARALLKHQTSRQSSNPLAAADARWARNSDGFTPHQVANRRGHSLDLVELLHPLTDLSAVFSLQELVAPVAGVAKLSVIAAAALQRKLRYDLQRASDEFRRDSSPAMNKSCTALGMKQLVQGAPQPISPFQRHTVAWVGPSPALGSVTAMRGTSRMKPPLPPKSPLQSQGVLRAADSAASDDQTSPLDVALEGDVLGDLNPASFTSLTGLPADGNSPTANPTPVGTGPAEVEREVLDGDQAEPGEEQPLAHRQAERLLSGGSSDLDPNNVCALCFDRVPDVGVDGCHHKLCSQCAEMLCSRVTNKPLACPFCRKSIGAFIGTGE